MILNTIHHIAIICSDKDEALHFYHDILGFPIIRSNFRQGRQDWKIDLRINETTELELFIMSDRPARVTDTEAYGLRHLAFAVSSVADTVVELENAGIPCEPVRLDAYTGKPMTFFRDPDGLPIEIFSLQKGGKTIDEPDMPVEAECSTKSPYEVQTETLVFGGHTSWTNAIKPMLTGNVRFIDKDYLFNINIIKNADMIWIQTNALSHKMYYRIVDTARALKIPIRYFASASAQKCAGQVMAADRLPLVYRRAM